MSDLISRQAAIDAIRAYSSKYTGFMEMEMYTDDDAVEAIQALPSTQPEQKHGEWWLLETPDNERTEYGQCSLCGDYFYLSHRVINSFKYCPNCGAKMDMERE